MLLFFNRFVTNSKQERKYTHKRKMALERKLLMKRKMIVSVLLTLISTLVLASLALGEDYQHSANDIKIDLNGKYLSSDVCPIILEERTMVPVRVICENLGAKVSWNESKGLVEIQNEKNDMEITISIASEVAIVKFTELEEEKQMDVAPFIKDQRTMVPLGLIAELLSLEVKWDEANRTICLNEQRASVISAYSIVNNEYKEARLLLNISSSVNEPAIRVLSKDEQVFKGEGKIIDPSLGEYRLELMFKDTQLSEALREQLGLETVNLEGDNQMLESLRLAYSPDDSATVIYLGCFAEPRVELLKNKNNLLVSLIAESIQDGIKFTAKNLVSSTEALEFNLSIPMLDGLNNKEIQNSINDRFEKEVIDFKDEISAWADEYLADAKKEGWLLHPYEAFTDYRVKYCNNDILSLCTDYYQYTGGAHGMTTRHSSTIDLKTGKSLSLRDIFNSDLNYKKIINTEIKRQMRLNSDLYFDDSMEQWESIREDQGFYIEDDQVVIYFGLYEIAPYVHGIPEFNIDLDLFGDGLNIEI